MPSIQAQRLTAQYRRSLFALSDLVGRRVAFAAARPDAADIDSWWDRTGPGVRELIATGSNAATRLGGAYMTAHAAVEGVTAEVVRVPAATQQVATSSLTQGPVAYKSTITRTAGDTAAARHVMMSALQAMAQRLVAAGGRQTVLATIEASSGIIGYRRVAAASACAFCAMLASRGAVYATEAGAVQVGRGRDRRIRGTQMPGEAYHDHCQCTPEAIYSHEPEPASVLALREQWDESGGTLERFREFREGRARR